MKKIDIEKAKKIMFDYLKIHEEKLNPRYALEKKQTPELLEPKHAYKYISLVLSTHSEEENCFVFPLLFIKHTPDGLEECLMTGVLYRVVDKETGAVIWPNIKMGQSLSQYLNELKISGRLSEDIVYLPPNI